jgi:hypothetical protein
MKTVTGNTVRYSLSNFGTKVNDYASACAAVPFTFLQEPVSRASTGEKIPNSFGLFRSDNGGCVGIHSENFGFMQPSESLATLERARALVGGTWSSVASTKGGRQLAAFIQIEKQITAPKRGDKVGLSIAYFDRFDGTGKARLQLLANVLACDNGMTRSDSLVTFSERHCASIRERFTAMEFDLSMQLQTQIEEMQSTVNALDNTPITQSEVDAFARVLFPAADEANVPTRTANVRDAIATGFVRGTGNVGRTRWDAFNAVTEHLDWESRFRVTEFSREENRFESLVTGYAARIRSRALELLLN